MCKKYNFYLKIIVAIKQSKHVMKKDAKIKIPGLRAEPDISAVILAPSIKYFNPRAPSGARHREKGEIRQYEYEFQSTGSVRSPTFV